MFEYSKNSVEMLKFLSFTVYFLHFDDFFNQMCLKFSAFNKTANINFFKILLKCLKMTRWSFAVSLLHFHEFWTKYFWIFQHSTFSKWSTYIKMFEFYNFLLYSLELFQFYQHSRHSTWTFLCWHGRSRQLFSRVFKREKGSARAF